MVISKNTVLEIVKIVCTAIISVASALLATSCAGTTRVVSRSSTDNGGNATTSVQVTTSARQAVEVTPDSSFNVKVSR